MTTMQHEITNRWLTGLEHSYGVSIRDRPSYWTSNPASLSTTSDISDLVLGTGSSIYDSITPALKNTQHELIIVTCFWARSDSLTSVSEILRTLSSNALGHKRRIKVRIYFSSCSFLRRLFHTFSLHGQDYPPSSWSKKLGLPRSNELSGLDLKIKSVFVQPFGVMHPKFIIIDRKQVFLPSCNVSWENWFEGCIGLRGEVVDQFVQFWKHFWANEGDLGDNRALFASLGSGKIADPPLTDSIAGAIAPLSTIHLNVSNIKTIFLPSSHHINPRFRFPWQEAAPAPPTPLNVFLLAVFRNAKQDIYIQTPNLTSPPVLTALLDALTRGINVHIVTSERLMILEQLVTAGTTTSRCVRILVRRYRKFQKFASQARDQLHRAEEGVPAIGRLMIEFYRPRLQHVGILSPAEPVQSHLKLTIADSELVILGSGNMDRASWYTSQELGVAFFSTKLATRLTETLNELLEDRKRLFYDSHDF